MGYIVQNKTFKNKDVLTTGQVAQICSVAPRTVTKWFDTGRLRGYRIPGSRDRRIPVIELIRFMRAHNIPTEMLESGPIRVLIIDDTAENGNGMAAALASGTNYDIKSAQNGFDAGVIAQRFMPHLVLLNLLSSNIDAGQICRNIRSNSDLTGTKVVAFSERLSESETTALLNKGFDNVIIKNGNIEIMIRKIEETVSNIN